MKKAATRHTTDCSSASKKRAPPKFISNCHLPKHLFPQSRHLDEFFALTRNSDVTNSSREKEDGYLRGPCVRCTLLCGELSELHFATRHPSLTSSQETFPFTTQTRRQRSTTIKSEHSSRPSQTRLSTADRLETSISSSDGVREQFVRSQRERSSAYRCGRRRGRKDRSHCRSTRRRHVWRCYISSRGNTDTSERKQRRATRFGTGNILLPERGQQAATRRLKISRHCGR